MLTGWVKSHSYLSTVGLFLQNKGSINSFEDYIETKEILGERAKENQVVVFIVLTEQLCSSDIRAREPSSGGQLSFLPLLLPSLLVLTLLQRPGGSQEYLPLGLVEEQEFWEESFREPDMLQEYSGFSFGVSPKGCPRPPPG